MQEMELYHIHKKNNVDNKWVINNEIFVGKDFDSVMSRRQKSFSQVLKLQDQEGVRTLNFSQYIAEYYSAIMNEDHIDGELLQELKQLLEVGYQMSFNADFFKREAGLEECRKDYFEVLPSRLHSIYLCDEDGVDYWEEMISGPQKEEVEIFKVLASGIIFKTNEQLIPNELNNYGQLYEESFKYWNPKFNDVPTFTNEYLAQGTIKVLSRKSKV